MNSEARGIRTGATNNKMQYTMTMSIKKTVQNKTKQKEKEIRKTERSGNEHFNAISIKMDDDSDTYRAHL